MVFRNVVVFLCSVGNVGNTCLSVVVMESMCRYRCTDNIAMPFKIVSAINDMSRTRIEVAVTVSKSPHGVPTNVSLCMYPELSCMLCTKNMHSVE